MNMLQVLRSDLLEMRCLREPEPRPHWPMRIIVAMRTKAERTRDTELSYFANSDDQNCRTALGEDLQNGLYVGLLGCVMAQLVSGFKQHRVAFVSATAFAMAAYICAPLAVIETRAALSAEIEAMSADGQAPVMLASGFIPAEARVLEIYAGYYAAPAQERKVASRVGVGARAQAAAECGCQLVRAA